MAFTLWKLAQDDLSRGPKSWLYSVSRGVFEIFFSPWNVRIDKEVLPKVFKR